MIWNKKLELVKGIKEGGNRLMAGDDENVAKNIENPRKKMKIEKKEEKKIEENVRLVTKNKILGF